MKKMKPGLMMAAGLLGALRLTAGELPQLSEKPWMGCWIGHEEREFDYSIGAKDNPLQPRPSGLLQPVLEKANS